ncbi:hypothetical protein FG379_000422 [Cryptosporidium bovis]|uniref:uncharacterized protein n=1 Tax=Cryptosporidium bovis TaxID=310047 RepID=UPI00351A05C5|nr:hypothetical protein FG379_000422 [Cryptosporidium bovis]
MSESKWMRERNSQIRIGPEFQAVLPDLIESRHNELSKVENNIKTKSKLNQVQQKGVCLIGGSEPKSASSTNILKRKTKSKIKQKETQNSSVDGHAKDVNKNSKPKVIKIKK